MNKKKLIEAKKVVMYEIGQSLEKTNKQKIDFSMNMAIAEILGDLTATLDDKLDDIIQSDPEEICNGCKYNGSLTTDFPCCICARVYNDVYEKAGE